MSSGVQVPWVKQLQLQITLVEKMSVEGIAIVPPACHRSSHFEIFFVDFKKSYFPFIKGN